MSKRYSCNVCNQTFNKKIELTNHKKNPCQIQEEYKDPELSSSSDKQTLINIFKQCLNVLRDNEGLTGDKALRTIAFLLILKLLEPRFGNEIDIDGYDYDFSHIEDCMVSEYKKKLLLYVRFSNLALRDEEEMPKTMSYLWEDILSKHPTTSKIFLKGKSFDIKHQSTYKKLIDKINELPKTENDVLGDAYEEVIQDTMKGKVLGQFFTQPLIKKMMVKLIDPQIYPDGKIDSCCDPTMGTGGFLITYLRYILDKAKDNNITPDWNFIKNKGIYGKELDPDTYQLAAANMLISSGQMFDALEQCDSIRFPIIRKFDNILANPPFGIKGLRYDDFKNPLKSEYTPIKTDNAVSLFIQAIIYMLKINGKCAVVLPDGQDLFSKSNKTLIAVREYLMKTCDLKEIIYLPSGMFEYTSIKTCIFYFVKKMEGVDVLETKIKISKTQREMGRNYKFLDTHQTTSVKFYECDPREDVKNLLVEVPIEKIASNAYSLNYAEYMKDETDEEQYEDGAIVKSIKELFKFNTGSLQAMKCDESNNYPVISSSDIHTHSSFELDGENIFILKIFDGSAGKTYSTKIKYFNGECNFTSLLYHMKPINKDILNIKYIYYYLNNNIDYISKKYQKGSCNKSLDLYLFLNYKIPIPSLDHQQQIVKYLDFVYEKTNKTSNEKISELKQLNEFCLNNQKIFGDNEVRTLGEVCKFLPKSKRQASYGNKEGLYPFFKSSNKINSYVDEPDYEEESLIIGDGGEPNINYGINFSTSDHCYILQNKNKLLLNLKYVYYYLYNNLDIMKKLYIGAAIKNISKINISKIKIPIPSLERQQEIVEYCENNDNLIKQLEKEIKNNKKQAQQFLTNVLKSTVRDEDENTETIHEPENSTTIEFSEDEEDTQEEENGYEETKE